MSDHGIVWFRRDLRLHDNPAWAAATNRHDQVTAVLVIETELLHGAGPFRRQAFLNAAQELDRQLAGIGGRLRVEYGDPATMVPLVASDTDASAIYVNGDVTRWSARRDTAVDAALPSPMHVSWGTLVHPPGSILTKAGNLSKVFTPFWKQWSSRQPRAASEAASAQIATATGSGLPTSSAHSMPVTEQLDRLLEDLASYPESRDLPAIAGTSRLSTALRFGTISPVHLVELIGTDHPGASAFVRQLAWRDWYAHTTAKNLEIDRKALRPGFDRISWATGAEADRDFDCWTQGMTGYPIVDAGMRELRATGWMHNRVRMVAASFLVKDLLIDWRRGERYFRHWLSDGDIPQNAGNWQWVAGTGPDAAPYFRIFNPLTQSRRFDPSGTYIRQWVPELSALSDTSIHEPWSVPPLERAAAGVWIGETYPAPIIDHAFARERTLLAYQSALAADIEPNHDQAP
ncbi:MAG: deoxyribodipyrimidine photo-lyase [Acidimicrobiaceae bacterium]|nr:deoxyribodipyrimidine photo-lyase [Acidimicrobiaceae bacterium]